jgi:hypothetical protein
MLALAATLLRWPQPGPAAVDDGSSDPSGPSSSSRSALTAFGAALAFALSPLAYDLGSRVAVSDSLFTATLALSLSPSWAALRQCLTASPGGPRWLLLGLAVVSEGARGPGAGGVDPGRVRLAAGRPKSGPFSGCCAPCRDW